MDVHPRKKVHTLPIALLFTLSLCFCVGFGNERGTFNWRKLTAEEEEKRRKEDKRQPMQSRRMGYSENVCNAALHPICSDAHSLTRA